MVTLGTEYPPTGTVEGETDREVEDTLAGLDRELTLLLG